MDLNLTFSNGTMSGDGNDDVGRFLIKGRYDAPSRECHWTKSYLGAHDVFYRGFREGKGIWGAWEISIFAHGGFHVWPRTAGESDQLSNAVEQTDPIDAIAVPATAPVSADHPTAPMITARVLLVRAMIIGSFGERVFATPALSGNRIFLRTQAKLYAFGE